jgi:hypothetical protein
VRGDLALIARKLRLTKWRFPLQTGEDEGFEFVRVRQNHLPFVLPPYKLLVAARCVNRIGCCASEPALETPWIRRGLGSAGTDEP